MINVKINDTSGVKLLTNGKFVREDINVNIDDTSLTNLVSENIKQGVSILGVEGVLQEGIIPSGTLEITSNGEQDVSNYEKVNVNVQPNLQEKEIIENGEFVADEGYDGLSKVIINVEINDMLQARVDSINSCVDLFYNYKGTNLDFIENLDTSRATSMARMFQYCTKLTTIPPLNTSNITDMFSAFDSCFKLPKIDISYYNINNEMFSSSTFNKCYSLKALIIRGFGENYVLDSYAFKDCYHLKGTINETYNPNGDKDCYIYVPRYMVETLKVATNWTVYADQIRALEDYTVDGTTTGALDESKI